MKPIKKQSILQVRLTDTDYIALCNLAISLNSTPSAIVRSYIKSMICKKENIHNENNKTYFNN